MTTNTVVEDKTQQVKLNNAIEIIKTHPEYINILETIDSDNGVKKDVKQIIKQFNSPIDLSDRLWDTYKRDPFRITNTILENCSLTDIKQFVDKRVIPSTYNKMSNISGIQKDIVDNVDCINFLLYCKSVEGKNDKWGTEGQIEKQYRKAAWSLIKLARISDFLGSVSATKVFCDDYTKKKVNVFSKKQTLSSKKVNELKPFKNI